MAPEPMTPGSSITFANTTTSSNTTKSEKRQTATESKNPAKSSRKQANSIPTTTFPHSGKPRGFQVLWVPTTLGVGCYLLIAETDSLIDAAPSIPRNTKATGFITYLRIVWPEYLSIAVTSIIVGSIYFTPIYYYRHRVVPLLPSPWNYNATDPMQGLRAPVDFDYPWDPVPLPSLSCGVVVVLVPLLIIGLFQCRLRSLWDFHAAVVGILKAVVSTTLVCVILKQFVGGFRPYYMDACRPDMTMVYKDPLHERYWFNATACTGGKHEVEKALQTFPSGHTASAFASAIFLTLYLNAKLKVFADHASEFWAFIAAITPLIGASLISGSMYTSHQHHANDIVWGLIIGVSLGILAYRSGYAAVLDFRYNHIPLPPFSLRTRFCYALDALRPIDNKKSEISVNEDDSLVIWSWWKQSETTEKLRERERSWLRSIWSLKATSHEMGGILNCKILDGVSEPSK